MTEEKVILVKTGDRHLHLENPGRALTAGTLIGPRASGWTSYCGRLPGGFSSLWYLKTTPGNNCAERLLHRQRIYPRLLATSVSLSELSVLTCIRLILPAYPLDSAALGLGHLPSLYSSK